MPGMWGLGYYRQGKSSAQLCIGEKSKVWFGLLRMGVMLDWINSLC